MSPSSKEEITVQLFVPFMSNEENSKILLVHEKLDDFKPRKSFLGVKPAGYGIPGGGVEAKYNQEELIDQITRFIPIYGNEVSEGDFLGMKYAEGINPEIFLTGIKEGLEETGLMIRPTQILFEEAHPQTNHKVVVLLGKIISGKIKKKSTETDDCDLFDISRLPSDIYYSHYMRIIKAFENLGLPEMAAKVAKETK